MHAGVHIVDHTKRASTDYSLRGIKKLADGDPEAADALADELIKNTYRTLMTRGLQGCYLYVCDSNITTPGVAGMQMQCWALSQIGLLAIDDKLKKRVKNALALILVICVSFYILESP